MKQVFLNIPTKQADEVCPIHNIHMIYTAGHEPFCLKCQETKIAEEKKRKDKENAEHAVTGYLRAASLVDDPVELDYSFNDFKALDGSLEAQTRTRVKHLAYEYIQHQKTPLNAFLYGRPGAGKTMLAVSALNAINEYSKPLQRCMFVNINSLFLAIKDSFDNPSSNWTEKMAVDRLSSADVLVLDDLGSESVMDDGHGSASNFVQKILYQITNRQKRIIVTTNMNMSQFRRAYNPKIVSRLLAGSKGHQIDFSEIKDKRY